MLPFAGAVTLDDFEPEGLRAWTRIRELKSASEPPAGPAIQQRGRSRRGHGRGVQAGKLYTAKGEICVILHPESETLFRAFRSVTVT